MSLANFRFETDAGGIAMLTWDMAGRSMNVITPQVIDEIEHVVDHVVASAAIKGCVVTSGKDTFSGGADLSMLQTAASEYLKAKQEKGEEAATKLFFERAGRLLEGFVFSRADDQAGAEGASGDDERILHVFIVILKTASS